MSAQNSAASSDQGNGSGLHLVPPPAAAAAASPAGFWRRLPAAFIDAFIMGCVEKVIFLVIGISDALKDSSHLIINSVASGDKLALTSEHLRAQLFSFGIGALLYVGYCFAFYRWKAATPGKLALGLKVVDFESGERIGLGQTILREFFGKWFSFIPLMGGYLMAAFRRDKRALHDFVAGTQVRLRK